MTAPYCSDDHVQLYHGDCLEVLATLPDASVDSVVTDPPYGLANTSPEQVADTVVRWVNGDRDYLPGGSGFMGKAWDAFVPPVAVWDECLRVLKPGGHVLAFAGSRTHDLMTLALRLAGFDIRDSIAWLYGSGFPKSLDVSKAIDKQRDDYPAIREVVMFIRAAFAASGADRAQLDDTLGGPAVMAHFLAPSRSNAGCPTWEQWQALKTILRFDDSMDAEVWRLNGRKGSPGEAWDARVITGMHHQGNAIGNYELKHGVGKGRTANERRDVPATPEAERWQGWGTALKPAFEPVVVARKPLAGTVAANVLAHGTGALNIDATRVDAAETLVRPAVHRDDNDVLGKGLGAGAQTEPAGRWPTNVLLDDSQAAELDRQSGESVSNVRHATGRPIFESSQSFKGGGAQVDKGERGHVDSGGASRFFPTFRYEAKAPSSERPRVDGIAHPTVKPLDLMRWLVRLVTPPGGTVLEPFAGSGTTAEACVLEGFHCIAIERESDYLPLIVSRLSKPMQLGLDFGDAS